MPGWIIQGVRGEGKSLCAVGKIKEYMERGRPVATNLNLYLEKFLSEDNSTIAYRLPDHPRLEDFQLLPPAYDPKYKGEDMNGLLVLDELGTWLNARNWNDKKRLELLNWLFLSRKDHWDLILLAQDFEMIDSQVRTTLCDYLVQASRLDRQKIPYLSSLLKFFGLSGKLPRVHRYHVFYGMSLQTQPVETWSYTGKDFYSGYDTNQKFLNGLEPIGGTLLDMRATYSYIPANYLTRRVFIDRLNEKIQFLRDLPPILTGHEIEESMAKKGVQSSESIYLKIGFLAFALVGFLAWRFLSGGFHAPTVSSPIPSIPAVPISNSNSISPQSTAINQSQNSSSFSANSASTTNTDLTNDTAQPIDTLIDYLLKNFKPRLSLVVYSEKSGFVGNVDFYQNNSLVESYSISLLHQLGVALIHRDYGADLVYKNKAYILTAWPLVENTNQVAKASPL